jgi:hypothetical protein
VEAGVERIAEVLGKAIPNGARGRGGEKCRERALAVVGAASRIMERRKAEELDELE